jgi:hypothetical protein
MLLIYDRRSGSLAIPALGVLGARPLWYPVLRAAARYAWCWVSSSARCALRVPRSLVDRSSTTRLCIPSGPTLGHLCQSVALVLRRSAALALGCAGARSVPRLAIPARGDAQRSAASVLSGHMVLIFSAWGSLNFLYCYALPGARRSFELGPPTLGIPDALHSPSLTCLLMRVDICACMSFISACIHASHSASSIIFLNPSRGEWYILFYSSRGCYSKLLFADYRGGLVLVSKVSVNTSR